MRVLFFTQSGPRGASSRYRVYQYLPYLRARGWRCWTAPAVPGLFHRGYFFSRCLPWKATFSLVIALHRLLQALLIPLVDIVFIQKPLLPLGWPPAEPLLAKVAHALGKKVVFDFDDAIFTTSPSGVSGVSPRNLNRRFKSLIESADLVLAGNTFLRDRADAIAKRVEVLPTVVDTDRFFPDGEREVQNRPLCVGWMGSPTTALYLRDLFEVMGELSLEFTVRWVFVGAPVFKVDGVAIVSEPWDYRTEVSRLRSFDVFISPLRDSEWERGKCGLKVLTAMSVGLPVVASSVGVHNEIVQNGQSGFLASAPGQWKTNLARLLSDSELRKAMGRAARITAEESFSLSRAAPRLEQLLQQVRL